MKLSICFTIDSVEFTAGVIAGDVSLGGSESACLGVARALAARGHDVHIFTTQLGADAPVFDHAGVAWHDLSKLAAWNIYADWDVAIALRQPIYLQHLVAKYKILWSQDLMADEKMKLYIMSLAWTYDEVAYVSEFHRHQWEGWLPELEPIGWATVNGHDAALAKAVKAQAGPKNPNRIIHISRPERGLAPILAMWPTLKAAYPDAELALCRYSSMYDPQGWGSICQSYDDAVAKVNAEVGGITYLGELGKPALYQAIAESAVMWYPGVATFAETSCIAAIEAQACGTPFVGSWKGALPETVPSGVLIPGDAEHDQQYHIESIAAVVQLLSDCKRSAFSYRKTINAGLEHVKHYTYEAIAAEWEAHLIDAFEARYEAHKPAMLARMDREDDLVSGAVIAAELLEVGDAEAEAQALLDTLERVATGKSHTAENYAEFALDPTHEIESKGARHLHIVETFKGCRNLLDVACGNGAIAIMLAQADPERHVTAVDFSAGNIAAARKAAESFGVGRQITFVEAPAWNMETQQPSDWLGSLPSQSFDGAVCGEFLEHVTDAPGLINAIERTVAHMGRIAFTVPMGPLNTLMGRHERAYRSHVHHFRPADLNGLFGQKNAYTRLVMAWAVNGGRNEPVGNWIVSYRNDGPTGVRPIERRMLLRPYFRLTAGVITNDTTDLRRCLDAVWATADEIVIGDCGCKPGELDAIVAEFPRKTRIVPVGKIETLAKGFSEARNLVMDAAKGEWFLWIDSDELLCGFVDLGKYLDTKLYQGYVIPQNHLHLDRAMQTDVPIRLFKKSPDVQFYGVVHEQPQKGDCNGDITPILQLADVQIAHTGYLHESIRRTKAIGRNLPLLVKDQQVFPDRLLGKLLVLRDHANLGTWELERTKGVLTDIARHHFGAVVTMFEAHFNDPTHKFFAIGKPFYEQAIQHVNGAQEVEVRLSMGAAPEGLKAQSKPVRFWIRTPAQLRARLLHEVDELLKPFEHPTVLDVAPLGPQPVSVPVEPERQAVSA